MTTLLHTRSDRSRQDVDSRLSPLALGADPNHVVERVLEQALLWIDRARQRRHLLALDDRELHDIGINRYDAVREGDKPFWQR
jgi:uncharacterized protein YjiS (DUF1127 family)